MIIRKIEPVNTKKKKLTMEDGRVFALYNGELFHYKLSEGMDLSDSVYTEILDTVLIKRARERMMHLLKDRDYTESQLYRKLKQGFYPEEAIEEAMRFGKAHHYIDDVRYARVYAEQKAGSMSRRQLAAKLSEKGIKKEIIDSILPELENSEEYALEKLIRKKNIEFSAASPQERQKICAYFMRKGFSYENILRKINEIEGTEHLT